MTSFHNLDFFLPLYIILISFKLKLQSFEKVPNPGMRFLNSIMETKVEPQKLLELG